MITIPKYWNMKNCIPFSTINNQPKQDSNRTIYIIMFFHLKRSLLFDRRYSCLGQMETRYAKKLITEAQDLKWVVDNWKDYGVPNKVPEYPKSCKIAYWIDANPV